MPAQNKSAGSLLGAVVGTLGFSALAGLLVTVMVAPAIAVTGIAANNSISIFDSLPSYIVLGQQRQQNEIYLKDAAGTPFRIATVYDQNREEIPLASMGKFAPEAAIAGEDRRFYQHGGVDLQSLVRAAIGQAGGADGSGGASTITMQTVRNIKVQDITYDDNLDAAAKKKALEEEYSADVGRKLQEMRLAISLEKKYDKKTILQGYLNIANFGANTYGIQAAARQYFSVDAKDLTPAQAASIIAIVQNPSQLALNNEKNFKANQERRDKILTDMHTVGYLTDAELAENLKIPVDANFLKVTAPTSGCRYADQNYALFCDYIRSSVSSISALGSTPAERVANWSKGGYKLYGTLDTAAQQVARATVQKYAPPTETRFYLGAAVATVEPGTGKILVMAQNKDFDDSPTPTVPNSTAQNFAALGYNGQSGGFQPGSTYKAFTLMAYLAAGNGLQSTFNASVRTIPWNKFKSTCGDEGGGGAGYKFQNDANEGGSYTVLRGTAASVNSVFLQMATKVDQCSIRDIASDFGMFPANNPKGELHANPSCAIGTCSNNTSPLMVAAAYAGIAAAGKFCKPIAVDEVVGPDGAKLPGQDAQCQQVLDASVVNSAAYSLQGVYKPGGTAYQGGSAPKDGTPYLGKTGTTDRAFQVWTTGASTAASTSVWVGNWKAESSKLQSGGYPDMQNLRQISVAGTQAALLRHRIFYPIARQIDTNHKGVAFPDPDPTLLKGKPAIVPGVIGNTVAGAQPLIENANLVFADGGAIPSSEPAGTIVSQDPAKDTSVPQGTTVTVFTSDGQGVTVPDVSSGKNLQFNDAKTQLQNAGFSDIQLGNCTSAGNATDPQNVVVAQSPAAGVVTSKTQTIKLDIQRFHCT